MKMQRRAFMEMAGASALSLGVPAASLKASQKAEANLSTSALVELNNLPFFQGREYFVLRSGRARAILQVDRADLGPAFTWVYFDAQNPAQSREKARAFNFDAKSGFAASALQVELGGFVYTAYGGQTEWRWVKLEGTPAVEVVWWAGGIRVTERVVALADVEAFSRTILLEGAGLAGEEAVNLRLFLPRGQFRSSGWVLARTDEEYGCGVAVRGDVKVRMDEAQGSIGVGPLMVGAHTPASVEVVHFFQIPDQGMDALLAQGGSLIACLLQERQNTQVSWAATSTLETADKTLMEIYDKARIGLPGMIAEDGTMNAGIFQYGRQWVRDTSNSALGAIHAGHFELAHNALRFL